MLVFGFVSLIIGLVFCAWMCREGSPDAPLPPNSELYWTHHWYLKKKEEATFMF